MPGQHCLFQRNSGSQKFLFCALKKKTLTCYYNENRTSVKLLEPPSVVMLKEGQ